MLALVATVAGGCAAATPKASEIEGSWKLEAFGGITALERADPSVTTTLKLAGGKATGNGGVNGFGGTYDAKDGGKLRFGPITHTEMAGSDAANKQETKFFEALDKTRSFELNEGKLILTNLDNDTLAIFASE